MLIFSRRGIQMDFAMLWESCTGCCLQSSLSILEAQLPDPDMLLEMRHLEKPRNTWAWADRNHLEQADGTGCCSRWPEVQTGICRGCDTASPSSISAFHWTNLSLPRSKGSTGAFRVSHSTEVTFGGSTSHTTHGIKPSPKTEPANAFSSLYTGMF